MPQNTSRGYTYPLYTDANDFPAQIQDLATDIDTDMAALFNRVITSRNQPACGVEATANLAIASSTDVTATYTTELYDNAAMVNLGVSNTTITFPESGIYIATARVTMSSNGNALGRRIYFSTTGPEGIVSRKSIQGQTGVAMAVSLAGIFYTTAGSTMTMIISQNSGAALNAQTRRLHVAKVSNL